MTTRKYSSRSQQTTLSGALTSSGTTTTVVSGSSLAGGVTISAGETFTVVIDPDTALEEIVDVTAISGNTLTIVRGIDGSSGVAHSAGAVVRHMAIGRDYREANTHIENTSSAHGLTIADVVTTTNTKTLTNKTISAADNTLTGVATLTGTQTLTNKTLTSPTITGTGAIAGTFTGNLTGNVTGNVTGTVSGNAGTVTNGVYTTDTGTVTSTMIANGTIVNADINSSAAIDKTKISGTAITAADSGTVTSTMIADGTIVNADVSTTAAIAKTKLDLGGTITSADLVDGTIVATDIADGTITAAKMVSDPYARANHTGTQLASTVSDFDTQVRTSKLNQMAAPAADVSMATYKITNLGTPVSNTDASTKLYVDSSISALVNGAPGTLDTLKEIADAISSGGTFYDAVVLKAGGTMTGALVLNADPSVNLGAATKQYVDAVAGSATAAAASAAAAATTYDNFDDRYLGAKSSAPSVDNDGNALITGAIYWNSTSNAMYVWSGSAWGSISSTADIYRYRYTATGGETTKSGADDNGLTLSYIVGKEQVYLNGVLLSRTSDYVATNGTSIASLAALSAGDILEIITFTAFEVVNVISPTVIDAKGDLIVGTSADVVGKLTVGSNDSILMADSTTATGLKYTASTGTGSNVLATSPTLVTPNIGVATATSVNGTTIPSSVTLVSTAATQTLTNKTLTSPTIDDALTNYPTFKAPTETANIVASAATGTINIDVETATVWYYTSNATANHTVNFRYNSTTSLSSKLSVGETITIVWITPNGTTAYYPSVIQVDGSVVTPKIQGGTAISGGNASATDIYSFTIIKTAATPTYLVLESQTKFV